MDYFLVTIPISFSEFTSLITCLKELDSTNQSYLDTVPADIKPFVFDTSYTNNLQKQIQVLLKAAMGEAYADIEWLLYECKFNSSSIISVGGKSYTILTLDDYFCYAKAELFQQS